MRFRKSTEYSIRCLVYMARHEGERCSVKRLAHALDIPYKFLGRLMSQLARAGIIAASRGPRGGYEFNRPLDSIKLAEIVEAVEGDGDAHRCILGFQACDASSPCPLHKFWEEPRRHIIDMLERVTLADVAADEESRI